MMKLITHTFVLLAADCPVAAGTPPLPRGDRPTVAVLQHALLTAAPYTLTLEELMRAVFLRREGLHVGMTTAEAKKRAAEIEEKLFGKPYPCMRASPLPKTYGFGVHYDETGKLAIYGAETADYRRLAKGPGGIKVVKAMAAKRAKG